MIESWKKYFGTGWPYGKEPSKQDCFKAGYEAALREPQPFQEFKEDGTFTSEGYLRRLKATPQSEESKDTRQKIREWQEKFEPGRKQ